MDKERGELHVAYRGVGHSTAPHLQSISKQHTMFDALVAVLYFACQEPELGNAFLYAATDQTHYAFVAETPPNRITASPRAPLVDHIPFVQGFVHEKTFSKASFCSTEQCEDGRGNKACKPASIRHSRASRTGRQGYIKAQNSRLRTHLLILDPHVPRVSWRDPATSAV